MVVSEWNQSLRNQCVRTIIDLREPAQAGAAALVRTGAHCRRRHRGPIIVGVRLLAEFFLIAWLAVAVSYLPVMAAEAPVPDSAQSTRLTDYLHAHRLPLVGAQVLNSDSGRSVLLYGYTATDFGKRDAASKARRFLRDDSVAVDNHIMIRPELASMKSAAPALAPSDNAGSAESPDVQAYKNQQQEESQQQYLNQQQQSYMNQGNTASNMATMSNLTSLLIPLLGMGMGVGIGGGSSGFSMGGYGSPYGGFGGAPYGSPYGGSPYGSPYGPNPYAPNPYAAPAPYGTYPYGGPSTYP
jgi:hypothetical protein